MSSITLSIVILNYNTSHLLRLCLKNLLKLQIPFPYEVIVVDNGSRDNSAEVMRTQYPVQQYPHTQFIRNKKNLGYAAGNNIGLRAAQGDIILSLNTDVIFSSAQDIVKIINYLDQYPKIGMLGPRLLNADGTVQYSCYRPYSFFTPLYRRTPLGRLPWAQRDISRHLMYDFDHNQTRQVDWLMSSCIFMRKKILDQIGYFDERFFVYFSDFELCDRLSAYGWHIVYYAPISAIHYHRRESLPRSRWSALTSVFNYATRIHLKDWMQYLHQHHENKYSQTRPRPITGVTNSAQKK